jgi:hypothetical protein
MSAVSPIQPPPRPKPKPRPRPSPPPRPTITAAKYEEIKALYADDPKWLRFLEIAYGPFIKG